MKKVNGKQKGSSFERTIAKKLSLYLTDNERDDTIWRSISSGAFATNRKKKGLKSENQTGDLTSISEESKLFFEVFSIECKSYKKIDLYHLIDNTSNLEKWYKKLYEDTIENDPKKSPLLIFKQDFKPVMCVCNTFILDYFMYNFVQKDHPDNCMTNFSEKHSLSATFNIPNNIQNSHVTHVEIFQLDDLLDIPLKQFKQSLIQIKKDYEI